MSKRREWLRRYPPLIGTGLVLFLVAVVLPSALNLPQTNPTETLEYAPVPPDKDRPPPPVSGNFASLGLGTGGGVGPGGSGPGGADIPFQAKTPTTKRCVGNPPKQIDAILAPPCVAYWEGNNFGSTYTGVTRDEVRLLVFYDDENDCTGARGCENRPEKTYWDLVRDKPDDNEHIFIRALRRWQVFFNDRFQTYGRFVRFHIYFADNQTSAITSEGRRADAADNVAKVDPFVIVDQSHRGNAKAYLETVAQKGRVSRTLGLGEEYAFYRRYPAMLWGFLAPLEIQTDHFAEVVCKRVLGHKVSFAGDINDDGVPENGKQRKFGYVFPADTDFPELARFASIVKQKVQKCGMRFDAEHGMKAVGYVFFFDSRKNYNEAVQAMAEFKSKGITTIVWATGWDQYIPQAANQIRYYPEIVVAGDTKTDGDLNAITNDQNFWEHAMVVSPNTRRPPGDSECWRHLKEIDPAWSTNASDINFACNAWDALVQVFTGIQVAGPDLSPRTMDRGFHAIPRLASTSPFIPACFYDPGDYTCIKDMVVAWYNRNALCYALPEDGRRYLVGGWPTDDIAARNKPGRDPCGGFAGVWRGR